MNTLAPFINQLRDKQYFSELDLQFAEYLARTCDCTDHTLVLGAALVSYLTAQGHVCVELAMYAEQPISSDIPDISTLYYPSLSEWIEKLSHYPVVGRPGDYTPLILENTRLYLYRYWDYEYTLAIHLRRRIAMIHQEVAFDTLQQHLEVLQSIQTLSPEQITAIHTAISSHFCILSGGPGTGKTFTIAQILWLLLQQQPHLRIALTAPTGKAAARLQETIRNLQSRFPKNESIVLPQEAFTLHRLLKKLPNHSPYFYFDAQRPLPYDVIIVDEASMVDLALMTKLAQAIPTTARWILVGDKDQLASVEAGTVLGDICEIGLMEKSGHKSLSQNIILLQKNYRFDENSGIRLLAQAVKNSEGESALNILKNKKFTDVAWYSLPPIDQLLTELADWVIDNFSNYLCEKQPDIALQQFEKFRILCALRRGPYGVIAINRLIERLLSNKGLISLGYRWYPGQPIMITRNDYRLRLFNGDIGLILWNPDKRGELLAFFPPTQEEKGVRYFWPNRLPEHETVYAMTIHKSQGSEFEKVLLLLPEQFSPILSRELIYTGITRAKQRIDILGNEDSFIQAVAKKISRASGLGERLVPKTIP